MSCTRRRFLLLVGGGSIGGLAACTPTAPSAPTPPPAKPTEVPKPGAAAPTSVSGPATQPTAAAKPAARAKAGSSVTIGYWQRLLALNVLYATGGGSLSAAKLAQRGLLFGAASNWAPELATEVPSLANGGISPDGRTITYKLRRASPGTTGHRSPPPTCGSPGKR